MSVVDPGAVASRSGSRRSAAGGIASRTGLLGLTEGSGLVGALTIVGLAIFSLVAAAASPYTALDTGAPALLPPGSGSHYLGTDPLGRDLLAGLAEGTQVSLIVGLVVALASTLIGVAVGLIAGYAGGLLDDLLMRATELFLIVPRFFLALLIVAIFGPSLVSIVIVLSVLSWPATARVVRAETLTLKSRDYVEAAQGLGMGTTGILVREILPNALPSAIVMGSLLIAQAILMEASLSFLGLGDPNVTSLGRLIVEAQGSLASAPWLSVIPGVVISVAVIAFNLIGDALSDAIGPRRVSGL